MLSVNFKREYIDAISMVFNSFNKKISYTISKSIDSWSNEEFKQFLDDLKNEYIALQENVKYLFVEIRLNLLLLTESKDKEVYKNYCQISFKAVNTLITPEKIEEIIKNNFGDYWSFNNSYFNADLIVENPDLYNITNYLYSYTLMLCYYHAVLNNIFNNLHTTNFNDTSLSSMDSDKNTINSKLLLIYYLIKDGKIKLNIISQDDTKLARIFSFLFDNNYDNIRKNLPNLQEGKANRLKTLNNLQKVSEVTEKLGVEFRNIREMISNDLEDINIKK